MLSDKSSNEERPLHIMMCEALHPYKRSVPSMRLQSPNFWGVKGLGPIIYLKVIYNFQTWRSYAPALPLLRISFILPLVPEIVRNL
jgi:hypothetical protein